MLCCQGQRPCVLLAFNEKFVAYPGQNPYAHCCLCLEEYVGKEWEEAALSPEAMPLCVLKEVVVHQRQNLCAHLALRQMECADVVQL